MPGPQDTNLLGQKRTFHISKKTLKTAKNIMISKGFYFSSKKEKNKDDRDFNIQKDNLLAI